MVHKIKEHLENYIKNTEHQIAELKASLRVFQNDLKELEDNFEGDQDD